MFFLVDNVKSTSGLPHLFLLSLGMKLGKASCNRSSMVEIVGKSIVRGDSAEQSLQTGKQ